MKRKPAIRDFLDVVMVVTIVFLQLLLSISILRLHISNASQGDELLISPRSVDTYLGFYSEYISLFSGTIEATTAYFGFHRLEAASDQN